MVGGLEAWCLVCNGEWILLLPEAYWCALHEHARGALHVDALERELTGGTKAGIYVIAP